MISKFLNSKLFKSNLLVLSIILPILTFIGILVLRDSPTSAFSIWNLFALSFSISLFIILINFFVSVSNKILKYLLFFLTLILFYISPFAIIRISLGFIFRLNTDWFLSIYLLLEDPSTVFNITIYSGIYLLSIILLLINLISDRFKLKNEKK
jgi:hypothetical protein